VYPCAVRSFTPPRRSLASAAEKSAYLHEVPCPSDALAGRLLPIAGPIPQLRPSCRSSAANSVASRFRLFNTPRVRRLPARPLRASPVPPVESVSTRRHPWDSSLQRIDHVLSRTPLGSPCPSFPWLVASSCRHPDRLAAIGLTGRIIHRFFMPVAPGCRISPPSRCHLQGVPVNRPRYETSCRRSTSRDSISREQLRGLPGLPGCPGRLTEIPKDSEQSVPNYDGLCSLCPSAPRCRDSEVCASSLRISLACDRDCVSLAGGCPSVPESAVLPAFLPLPRSTLGLHAVAFRRSADFPLRAGIQGF